MRLKRPILAGNTIFDGTWTNRFPDNFLKGEAASAGLKSATSRTHTNAIFVFMFRSEPSPGASIARQEFVCFFWSPGTCRIKVQLGRVLFCRPRLFDDVDERPGLFDFVARPKQSCVAAHRVEQQTFVRFRTGFAE